MVACTSNLNYAYSMFEECLYFNVTKFTRTINVLWEESYRPVGLSPSHAYMMLFILENPGETPNKLAQRMGLKISTVTRFIDSLSAKGLVERKKENTDKRECSVYATKSGENLKIELKKISKKLHTKIRKILGETNVAKTIDILKKFNTAMNNENEGK